MRILVPENLVMLHEVDAVGCQAPKGLAELSRRLGLGSTIDLGHQKDSVPVPIAKRFAHARFTRALVVVPAVIQEIDAAVDGSANDADARLLIEIVEAK